jgi:cyclic dehypoxanthinyl futalosine synthase
MQQLADKVRRGERLTRADAVALYREAPTALLGRLADEVRARLHPDRIVTYIIDRNVNYTNVCVARCNFCAFYRPVGHGDGYVCLRRDLPQDREPSPSAGTVAPAGWPQSDILRVADLFRP